MAMESNRKSQINRTSMRMRGSVFYVRRFYSLPLKKNHLVYRISCQ